MLPEAEFVAGLQFRLIGCGAGDAAKEARELARGAERGVVFVAQGEHLLPLLLRHRRQSFLTPANGLAAETEIAHPASGEGGDAEVPGQQARAALARLHIAHDHAHALELEGGPRFESCDHFFDDLSYDKRSRFAALIDLADAALLQPDIAGIGKGGDDFRGLLARDSGLLGDFIQAEMQAAVGGFGGVEQTADAVFLARGIARERAIQRAQQSHAEVGMEVAGAFDDVIQLQIGEHGAQCFLPDVEAHGKLVGRDGEKFSGFSQAQQSI